MRSRRFGPRTARRANLAVKAGDCIVFTEALRHAILRWDAPYPRLTVFNRYRAAWGVGSFEDIPEQGRRLPKALLALQAASAPQGVFGYQARL